MSFTLNVLIKAHCENDFIVHFIIDIKYFIRCGHQRISAYQLRKYIACLCPLMESQINLSQQCHCSTGGRTSRISTRIRRRQHILIDNLIQIAGKKIKDLLL